MGRVPRQRTLIVLWCLAAAGCGRLAEEAPKDAAPADAAVIAQEAATAESAVIAEAAAIAAAPPVMPTASSVAADVRTSPPSMAPVAPLGDGTQSSVDEPSAAIEVQRPLPSVAAAALPAEALEPSVVPAAPVAHDSERASGLIAPSAALPPAAEPLDFRSLATRLRKTKAINLRTKFAVKNESDDLLDAFRAYHARQGTATLAELRRSYDALFRKLYSLLEQADPPLAREIDRSRPAIWAILADPLKFRASAPMASARREMTV